MEPFATPRLTFSIGLRSDRFTVDLTMSDPREEISFEEFPELDELFKIDSALPMRAVHEFHSMMVREAATREFALRQRKGTVTALAPETLSTLLARDEEAEAWRIDRIWPANENVLLAGAPKAGKSSFLHTVLRSLADGVPLLGCEVTPMRRVVVLDVELSRRTAMKWLAKLEIENTDSILLEFLRGNERALDPTSPTARRELQALLRDLEPDGLVIDPAGTHLAALGMDENSNADVTKYLTGLASLAASSGVAEVLCVHHFGHTGDRARGATAWQGWAGSLWNLTIDKKSHQRSFEAHGRHEPFPKSLLRFDEISRTVELAGSVGETAEAASRKEIRSVLRDLLVANPGIIKSRLITAAQRSAACGTEPTRREFAALVDAGLVRIERQGTHSTAPISCFASDDWEDET